MGYGLEGGRAVAELMYADFMGRAGDEIFNQLSKWQAMSGGTADHVRRAAHLGRRQVRRPALAGLDARWSATFPGLKVVYPVTPYDAKGMMNAALAGTDPVVFFESQKIYDFGEMFDEAGVPEGYYEIDLSEPSIKRTGKDLTIITLRTGAVHGRRGRRPAGGRVRDFRGTDRPSGGEPAQLRAARRVGEEDRQGAAGLRRRRARLA